MEMTIEEHVEVLNSYNHGFTGYAGNLQDSIYVAVDTMRKYQKIEQIYSDYLKYMNPDNLADRIGEVLEDGNDDCR